MTSPAPVAFSAKNQTIIKRSGKTESFSRNKIKTAVYKCLKRFSDTPDMDAEKITERVIAALPGHSMLTVEMIQDAIEKVLIDIGKGTEAVAYHQYRSQKKAIREEVPIDPATQEKFDSNKQYFKTPIQMFQYFDKYSRWIPELKRRETWPETCNRVMDFLKRESGAPLEDAEWEEMHAAMLNLDALPSLRVVQMAGPALERDHTGVYNCSFLGVRDLDCFAELLFILMQGVGVGFSVEDSYVSQLPRIKKQKRATKSKYTIPDTTEGWCDALKLGLKTWFSGKDIEFDYTQIRPEGSPLKTKSGQASGPAPLKELLDFTRKVVLSKQGNKLSSLDCHDICCFCGQIVQVGGVRRAAEISLSDLDDKEMALCKSGKFWEGNKQRFMANNSAVFEERPQATEFMEEWLSLAKSGTGERGIFNRKCHIPERRIAKSFGINPCGEVVMRDREFCNLSICVARPLDNIIQLKHKVRVAAMFGTVQATLTNFPYLRKDWKDNCIEERLLGVDITGQRDCHILQSELRIPVLNALKDMAVKTNQDLSRRLGIKSSAAVTCVKPSGNSSTLLDCAPGIHVRYSPYYIRRVRTGAHTPVASLLKEAGVLYSPETGQGEATASILVFEFPVKAPQGAVCNKDVSAKDQLLYWLDVKKHYAEHSVSCTIYVEDHEWLELGALLYENWDDLVGLTFLPKSNHIYPLAPYQEITEEEYNQRVAAFPEINWAKLTRYEVEDQTTLSLEYACTSGACEL